MGHRLSKIYTRTGDQGTTGLGDGSRVDKDCLRVETYGTVDELNSAIGVVLAYPVPESARQCLTRVQHDLFDLGGELCIPGHTIIDETYAKRLEEHLDQANKDLPKLKEFILPGGNHEAAACHLARAICRRAERRMVNFSHNEHVNPHAIVYLNRLSDLLFVIARVLTRASGDREVLWKRDF
ncbi:MAG: cob(I)yrinic acid a,c-diamide adenosyltransferase [Gammaproteobacteria bacterium]